MNLYIMLTVVCASMYWSPVSCDQTNQWVTMLLTVFAMKWPLNWPLSTGQTLRYYSLYTNCKICSSEYSQINSILHSSNAPWQNNAPLLHVTTYTNTRKCPTYKRSYSTQCNITHHSCNNPYGSERFISISTFIDIAATNACCPAKQDRKSVV